MWPTSTNILSRFHVWQVLFQSLKRDVAYFHYHAPERQARSRGSFNRSSAMWPTSTGASRRCPGMPLLFQSLKRDVAYFHDLRGRDGAGLHTCFNRSSAMWPTSTHSNRLIVSFLLSVSIAQARCGLLPLFTTDK